MSFPNGYGNLVIKAVRGKEFKKASWMPEGGRSHLVLANLHLDALAKGFLTGLTLGPTLSHNCSLCVPYCPQ